MWIFPDELTVSDEDHFVSQSQAKIANWLVLSFFPAFTTGELVRAKPSKIVAGQESEKTNEFLQMLSIAILKQVWVWVGVSGGGWVGRWEQG